MLDNFNPDIKRGFFLGIGALTAAYLVGVLAGVFKKVL